MSTNASISIMNKDGSLDTIYNHWDGSLRGLGIMLTTHYTNAKKVKELINLGNVSYVGSKVNPTTSTHSFDNPEDVVTVAYGRDRGEPDQEAIHFNTFAMFGVSGMLQEFNYIFNDGYWFVFKYDDKRPTEFSEFINISRLM